MKLSAWVTVSDLIPVRKTKIETLIDFVLGDKLIFRAHTTKQVFNKLKQAGVDGIELLVPLMSSDENIADIIKITRKYKLPILSIHQSLTSLTYISLTAITRLCKIAHITSAKIVVLHSGALGNKLSSKHFITTLKIFEKKYKIKFGIENMQKTPLSFRKKYTYKEKEFAVAIRKTGLSITLDTTHLAQAGGNILSFYEKNKKNIVNIHLSDFEKNWLNTYLLLQSRMHLPLSKGNLPILKLLRLLKDNRYTGLITMEIDGKLNDLCDNAQMIKSIWTKTYSINNTFI